MKQGFPSQIQRADLTTVYSEILDSKEASRLKLPSLLSSIFFWLVMKLLGLKLHNQKHFSLTSSRMIVEKRAASLRKLHCLIRRKRLMHRNQFGCFPLAKIILYFLLESFSKPLQFKMKEKSAFFVQEKNQHLVHSFGF